jgi:hypothetical protein
MPPTVVHVVEEGGETAYLGLACGSTYKAPGGLYVVLHSKYSVDFYRHLQ